MRMSRLLRGVIFLFAISAAPHLLAESPEEKTANYM